MIVLLKDENKITWNNFNITNILLFCVLCNYEINSYLPNIHNNLSRNKLYPCETCNLD